MRRTLATIATLSVALTLGLAPDIAAAGPKAGSTVTITRATGDPGGTTVKGKVHSSKSSCKKGRTVTVYHDVAPPGPSSKDFLLGTRWCKKDTSGTTPVSS